MVVLDHWRESRSWKDSGVTPVWISTSYEKFLKRWEYLTILPASWETFMQVKKQQSEPDIEQWTGSKSEKEYNMVVYCHPALTYT